MAGVPSIMQAMMDGVAPTLETGVRMSVATIEAGAPEGAYASGLGEIARNRRDLSIGSYPAFADGRFHNQIVIRGRDAQSVEAAKIEIEALLQEIRQRESSGRGSAG